MHYFYFPLSPTLGKLIVFHVDSQYFKALNSSFYLSHPFLSDIHILIMWPPYSPYRLTFYPGLTLLSLFAQQTAISSHEKPTQTWWDRRKSSRQEPWAGVEGNLFLVSKHVPENYNEKIIDRFQKIKLQNISFYFLKLFYKNNLFR